MGPYRPNSRCSDFAWEARYPATLSANLVGFTRFDWRMDFGDATALGDLNDLGEAGDLGDAGDNGNGMTNPSDSQRATHH